MTLEKYDLIVAGAGGGLIGAIKAAQLGFKVMLIDASPDFVNTCNTSMTSGMFPASGTRWQNELGIEDSPEKFQTDVMVKTNSTADVTVTKALTEISVELVEWMSDSLGVPWELVTDFHYPGHSVDRCLSVPGRMGILVLEPIWNEAKKQNLFDFMPSTRLQDIVMEDNRVVSAIVELADGKLQEISAKNVLIATNGYGANQKLLYEHNTEICYVHFQGSKYSRGDALAIGTKHELATGFLDAYQGHAAVAAHSKTLVGWTTIMQGGFILNLEGLRFGDESAGYSEYAAILNEQKSNSGWLIIDKGINDQSMLFKEYEITAASGAIVWAESLEELADKISIPFENLTAEVQSAASVNRGLEKDRFGRTDFARPLVAPFGAIKVRPALFHTQGGLMINEKAQSIKEDGTIVENLFVAGGAAIGISGHGSDGYLAGNGLLSAFGLAYIAAKSLKPDQG